MQYRVGKKKLYTLGFIACSRGKFNYYTFSVIDCYSRAIVVAVFLPQLVINHLLGSSSIRMLRPILCFFWALRASTEKGIWWQVGHNSWVCHAQQLTLLPVWFSYAMYYENLLRHQHQLLYTKEQVSFMNLAARVWGCSVNFRSVYVNGLTAWIQKYDSLIVLFFLCFPWISKCVHVTSYARNDWPRFRNTFISQT